jgi:hypothetical protein
VKRLILFGLLGGLLATNTGCGLLQAVFCYRPSVSYGGCGPAIAGENCDEGCGPTCGPVRRPIRASRCARAVADCDTGCNAACGAECNSCGDPCADPCGQGCYARPWHRGPLSCVFALLTQGCWWGRSCGERYWGDFYSDSPDCSDPCDCYGNYAGGGCRSCGGEGGGCNCGGGGYDGDLGGSEGYSRNQMVGRVDDGTPVSGNNVVARSNRSVSPAPRPVAQPHKAVRP